MNILVACECSGRVRDAFITQGHNAVSCDILPSTSPGPHIQESALLHLDDGWDIMIGFPPCRYLSFAGNRSWHNPGRREARDSALDFFTQLWTANIKHICLENPMGVPHIAISPASQIINPYYFGDPERKRTCLWLKNLPKLIHIKTPELFLPVTHVAAPQPHWIEPSGRKVYFTQSHNTKSTRAALRAVTFPGIAQAMAVQWSQYITTLEQ